MSPRSDPIIPEPGSAPFVVVHRRGGLSWLAASLIVVLVILLLVMALLGCLGYYTFKDVARLTSAQPASLPVFDGGDAMNQAIVRRIDAFQHSKQGGTSARLELSADELNTLIEHDPTYVNSPGRVFVSFARDEAEIQFSVPVSFPKNLAPITFFQSRYLNGEMEATPRFDASSQRLNLATTRLVFNGEDVSQEQGAFFQRQINSALNLEWRRYPEIKAILTNATAISIHDNTLTVQAH